MIYSSKWKTTLKKYRKSVLPAIYQTFPLILLTFILFTVLFAFWFYYAVFLPLLFLFLVIYRILDDYLDYITLHDDYLVIHIAQWLYHSSSYKILYKNMVMNPKQSFWQKIFFLGTLTITSEGKSFTIKNLTKFKYLINLIKTYE